MSKFITKEQVPALLSGPYAKVDGTTAIKDLISRGYEIEGLNATFSPSDALHNIDDSAKEFVKNIWSAVKNPVTTINSIGELAVGLGYKVANKLATDPNNLYDLPDFITRGKGEEEYTRTVDAMVDFYKKRYWSKDKLLNTIEDDPIGFLADVSTIFNTAGGVAKGFGKVANVVGKGGVAEKAGQAGKVLSRIGRETEPIGWLVERPIAVGKQMSANMSKAIFDFNEASGVHDLMRNAAASLATKATTASVDPAATLALKTFEKQIGSTIAEYSIQGSLPEMTTQLETMARNSKKKVDLSLGKVTETYNRPYFKDALDLVIEGLGEPKSPELRFAIRKLKRMRNKLEPVDLTTPPPKVSRANAENVRTGQPPVRGEEVPNFSPRVMVDAEGQLPPAGGVAQAADAGIAGQLGSADAAVGGTPISKVVDEFADAEDVAVLTKERGQGLTLTELNAVKRALDHFESPFTKSGNIAGIGLVDFTKASNVAEDVKNIRQRVQGFIEKEAAAKGFPKIHVWNRETIFGTELSNITRKAYLGLKPRFDLLESIVFTTGIAGSVLSANVTLALAATGIVLGKRYLQSAKFRTALAHRLMKLTDFEFKSFTDAVEEAIPTKESSRVIRDVFTDLKKLYPDIQMLPVNARNLGIITEETRKEPQ